MRVRGFFSLVVFGLVAFISPQQSHAIGYGEVLGVIDGVYFQNGGYVVSGWACRLGTPGSIDVHMYLGGDAGSGTFGTAVTANMPSEPAVAAACLTTGSNFRFAIPLTGQLLAAFGGKSIYIHGISANGTPNYTISNSGAFKIPAPMVTNHGQGCSLGECLWATGSGFGSHCTFTFYTPDWSIVPGTGSSVLGTIPGACSDTSGSTATLPTNVLANYSSVNVVIVDTDSGRWAEPYTQSLSGFLKPTVSNAGSGCDHNQCIWIAGANLGTSCHVNLYTPDWSIVPGTNASLLGSVAASCSNTLATAEIPQDILSKYPAANILVVNDQYGVWSNTRRFTWSSGIDPSAYSLAIKMIMAAPATSPDSNWK
jgi:hypothetical protein